MKSNMFLKVTGILMIIGGALSLLLVIFAGGLAMLFGGALGLAGVGLVIFSLILALVGSVIQFIAGIVGVKNAARPEKAMACIVWGFLTVAVSLLSNILSIAGGSTVGAFTWILGLALPALYLVGAFQNKSRAE